MSRSCENCNIKFYSQTSYYRHRKSCVKSTNKKIFKTCVCGKPFYSKSNFFSHKKKCKQETIEKVPFKNCDCGKSFASKSAYYYHKKRCEKGKTSDAANGKSIFKRCDCGNIFNDDLLYTAHKECCVVEKKKKKFLPKGNYKCQENNCSFSCNVRLDFLNHLKTVHSIDSCWEEHTFQSYEEFEEWKEQFEKSTKAFFKTAKVKKTATGTCKYFTCNRSGTYASKSTGKRSMKKKGLSKIGFNCTASIKVQLKENSSVVNASVCNLHYGHDNEVKHLRIFKSDRESIANQLAMGIEPSHVHKNIFSLFPIPTQLERQHLITKVDLKNISKAYGILYPKRINKSKKHSEDHLSADAYVEENPQQEKNIILYKRQEENSLYYPACTSSYTHQNQKNCQTANGFDNINCNINAECQNENSDSSVSQHFDQDYILTDQLTANVNTNLTDLKSNLNLADLKSNLFTKTITLCHLIENCNSKDLLLNARKHINSATSLLKLKGSAANNYLMKEKIRKVPANKNIEK